MSRGLGFRGLVVSINREPSINSDILQSLLQVPPKRYSNLGKSAYYVAIIYSLIPG